MSISKGKGLLLIVCLAFSQIALAQSEFEPAKFRDGDKIVEKIAFPRKGGDVNYSIPCNILLPLSGRIEAVVCYMESNDKHAWLFERAIYNALRGARMDRAMANGKARSVWLNFMVAFNRNGPEKSVEIYLNHASEFEKYGLSYIDPQRLIPLETEVSLSYCKPNSNVWIETIVGVEGMPGGTKVVGDEEATKCKNVLFGEYENSSFIPAHYKGQPVESQFYESLTGLFESKDYIKMLSARALSDRTLQRRSPGRLVPPRRSEQGRLN